MGKTNPVTVIAGQRRKRSRSSKIETKLPPVKPFDPEHAQSLINTSVKLLHEGEAFKALQPVKEAVEYLDRYARLSPHAHDFPLPALSLLGEVCVELGEVDEARHAFLRAVNLDPDGEQPEERGGGADKFLWLAQLCEGGGQESVDWFEKGVKVLRRDLETEPTSGTVEVEEEELADEREVIRKMKQQKLASALSGGAEVYMTDLSWEEDAETRASTLASEAVAAAPHAPEPLQTLASVFLSQTRLEEAQQTLTRSLELWQHLLPEDADIPEYATRISLARLLMEAEMEERAMDVLEHLISEDDASVEAWYLGGWCALLLANKIFQEQDEAGETSKVTKSTSRAWLTRSLKLYDMLDYEDERLQDHARELIQGLEEELGPLPEGEDVDAGEDEEWEVEDDEDAALGAEMNGDTSMDAT